MACVTNNAFVLMFPVSTEYASQINYILSKPADKLDINAGGVLGVYKTMLDTWKSGGRYLSGILMDVEGGTIDGQPVLSVQLIVSDEHGGVDSITKTNFIHAIMLSALERKEILVTDDILHKIRPEPEELDETEVEEADGHTMINNPFKQKGNRERTIKETSKEATKDDKSKFPVDKQILTIAKNIMKGKKNK